MRHTPTTIFFTLESPLDLAGNITSCLPSKSRPSRLGPLPSVSRRFPPSRHQYTAAFNSRHHLVIAHPLDQPNLAPSNIDPQNSHNNIYRRSLIDSTHARYDVMADRTQSSRRRQAVPEGLSETWAKDLTDQFRRLLSTRRMNTLNRRTQSNLNARSQAFNTSAPPPSTQSPPSYASLRNLPLVPTAPTDRHSLRFRQMLLSLCQTPCRWENPGLLDEALRVIPLERIYDAAQEESDLFLAEAASLGPNTKPAWGYQDCVVRALMRWFKKHFMVWINNPQCSKCNAPTIAMGMAAPVADEQARGATRVELYQCSNAHCHAYERFPRYNDAFVLLQTRKGRIGEWATCFGMLTRAVGSRVRWIWNSEDHVWIEVYSEHRKRWIHVDCVEELWDQPLTYTQGMFIEAPPWPYFHVTY